MPDRSRLLTTDDWSASELGAAVLAGELMPVGACWASVAEVHDERLRAESYAWSVGDERLVAARRSAAWIWGACGRPPFPHDASVEYAHRVRNRRPGLVVREVGFGPGDVVRVGAAAVTAPERTAVDMLREPDVYGRSEEATLCALVELGLVDADALRRRLAGLRRAPMARRAEARLARLGL